MLLKHLFLKNIIANAYVNKNKLYWFIYSQQDSRKKTLPPIKH